MSSEQPKLYSTWISSCAWRVRIALAYKQIPYETKTKALNTLRWDEDFHRINPMEQVPALYIDGHNLSESMAIMEYLDETRPERPILPKDAYLRAKVREICQIIVSSIQPMQNTSTVEQIGKARKIEWGRFWITKGFKALEEVLAQTAGKYCVGNEITIADFCLVPMVYNARERYDIDIKCYPTIWKVDKELRGLSAFTESHPSKQPDYPPEGEKSLANVNI